jgi:hypothetical protein
MSAVEKFGRSLGDNRAERIWTVDGTSSDTDARAQVVAAAPTSITVGTRVLQRESVEVDEVGNSLWLGIVTYTRKESAPRESGQSFFSFETRGGSQRITTSLETIQSYAPTGETAPVFGGLINVNGDTAEGIDIPVPVFAFNVTRYRSSADATFIGNLYALTATVNNGTFSVSTTDSASVSFNAGEVLFLGASGSKRGDEPWEISYAFAASPNVTGLAIGDITGIAKKGWEYLWTYYRATEDTGSKLLVQKPIAAFVERTFRSGNFANLDL